MKGFILGASPEVARKMVMACRNRHLADLMNDPFFKSEMKALRLSLIEQRKHLILAYGSATNNEVRKIILVLLNSADNFLQLLPVDSDPSWGEIPSDTVKNEMGIATGISPVPGKINGCGY